MELFVIWQKVSFSWWMAFCVLSSLFGFATEDTREAKHPKYKTLFD
ncbi:hypothetical protein [Flavobacterium gyeonganense]|uniref:Uncharacterized protein n=1 Tax=Flavobacterium gyeonganense TaxID=1310418 RepID=A0ABV5H6B0_9FLAO|nr:hypothetical protein [Flavobacterium gyeonganense]